MAGRRKLAKGVFSKEIIIFLFSFTAVFLLIYFAHIRKAGDVEGYPRDIDFDSIGQLSKGDKVYAQGLEIGQVKDVKVSPENKEKIRVTVTLDQKYDFREGYEIDVRSFGNVAGANVHIYFGNPTKDLSQDEVLKAGPPMDIMETASKVKNKLVEVVKELDEFSNTVQDQNNSLQKLAGQDADLLKEAKLAMADFEETGDKLKSIKDVYSELKKEATETFDSYEGINQQFEEIKKGYEATLENLKVLFEDFNNGESDLARLFNGSKEIKPMIDDISDNIKRFGQTFENKNNSLYLIMNDKDMKANFQSGETEYDNVAAQFEEIKRKFDNAEGTLGLWAKDAKFRADMDRVMDSVNDSINNLQRRSPYNTFSTYLFNSMNDD